MIYTRKGDSGLTDFANGLRVPKTDARIECVGSLDEFNSYIGLVLSLVPGHIRTKLRNEISLLETCQRRLFSIGTWASAITNPQAMPNNEDVQQLEAAINNIQTEIGTAFNGFIMPGGHTLAAHTHVARTLCRRTERTLLAAGAANWPEGEQTLPYINRLSDFLYLLAKKINHLTDFTENKW